MEESKTPNKTSITKEENGNCTKITVEEIENGFLITTCTYGEDSEGKYYNNEKKEFSKVNPLAEEKKEEESESKKLAKGVKGFFNSLASSEGMINIDK